MMASLSWWAPRCGEKYPIDDGTMPLLYGLLDGPLTQLYFGRQSHEHPPRHIRESPAGPVPWPRGRPLRSIAGSDTGLTDSGSGQAVRSRVLLQSTVGLRRRVHQALQEESLASPQEGDGAWADTADRKSVV